MAIDPLLYEKISGRSGDPYERLGQALAGKDAAKASRRAEREAGLSMRMMVAHWKYQLIALGAAVVFIAIVGAASRLFR